MMRLCKTFMGENIVKTTRGAKVKIFFEKLQMTHVIFVLIYNFKICILGALFNVTF